MNTPGRPQRALRAAALGCLPGPGQRQRVRGRLAGPEPDAASRAGAAAGRLASGRRHRTRQVAGTGRSLPFAAPRGASPPAAAHGRLVAPEPGRSRRRRDCSSRRPAAGRRPIAASAGRPIRAWTRGPGRCWPNAGNSKPRRVNTSAASRTRTSAPCSSSRAPSPVPPRAATPTAATRAHRRHDATPGARRRRAQPPAARPAQDRRHADVRRSGHAAAAARSARRRGGLAAGFVAPEDKVTSAAAAPPPDWAAPGLGRRLACMLYEGVLLFGVVMVAGLVYASLTQQRHALVGTPGLQVFLFVVLGLYFVWFWARGGQTVAMKTWHLRVVNTRGPADQPGAGARPLRRELAVVPARPRGGRTVGSDTTEARSPPRSAANVLAYALLARLHAVAPVPARPALRHPAGRPRPARRAPRAESGAMNVFCIFCGLAQRRIAGLRQPPHAAWDS